MTAANDKAKDKPACPKCGNRLRVLPDQLGTQVRCPKCNAAFVLGQPRKARPNKPVAAAPPLDDAYEPETPLSPSMLAPEAPGADISEFDDDAYEPEIPLTRSMIVPEEPKSDLRSASPAPAADDDAYEPEVQLTPSVIEPVGRRAEPRRPRQSAHGADLADDDLEREAHAQRPAVEHDLHLESARRRGLMRSYETADPPRWTFFSGVFGYPWRGVNVSRWTAMSFGMSIAGLISLKTLEYIGIMDGLLTDLAVQGLLLGIFAITLTLAVLSFACASCQAAIQDTADGHELPQEASLPEWDHWVFTFVAWFSLWAAAGALGYPLSLAIGPIAFLITSALAFPVLLLSAMESDSYIMPYSPPVLRTLRTYPHGWLMFYLLTTLMAAGWIVAFDWGFVQAPYWTVFLSGPVVATLMLLYARLLGRLAWRSGAPPAPVETDDEPRAAAQEYGKSPAAIAKARPAKRKQRTRIRIEIPDEMPPGDVPPQPPPRINFHLRP